MNPGKSYLKQFLYGPVFYNYLFILFQLAYNFIFRDMLLSGTMKTLYEVKKQPLLGITILAAVAAGFYAVMMTCRILRTGGTRKPEPPAFAICVLNWILSIHMFFTALQAFGIEVSKDYNLLSGFESAMLNVAIIMVLVQSAFFAGFIVRLGVPYEKTVGRAERIATDLASFFFACVSYTVMWETIMYKSVAVNGRYNILSLPGMFDIAGWTFLFLLFYPPMRFPYLLREMYDTSENANGKMILASYIMVIVTGIMPLVKIH